MWADVIRKMKELNIPQNSFIILKKSIYEHKISILHDWQQMTLNDGYENWRQKAREELENLIQTRFHEPQNPRDCDSAKVLKSTAGIKVCRWGCQFVEFMDKFAVAYSLKRLLWYIKPKNLFYEPDELELYYKPLSDNCNFSGPSIVGDPWPGNNESQIIMSPPTFRDREPKNPINAHMIPSDIAETAELLFKAPHIWWASQLDKYLLRLNEQTEEILNETLKQINFKNPIVGIHIRRTNKFEEVAGHSVWEYMEVADEFFDVMELTEKVDKRCVYIATDEPKVLEEARSQFPHYEILTNENIAGTAQYYQTHTASSLGVIIEGYVISKCDFFICTLSSNLGRRYYEYLHWSHRDATERMVSLDFHQFENNDLSYLHIAVMPHINTTATETSVEIGEKFYSLYTGWVVDYVIYGVNKRTNKVGYVPKFKLQRVGNTYKYNY